MGKELKRNRFFTVSRNVFAVIGVIATLLAVLYFIAKPYIEVDVYPSHLGNMESYIDSLRTSGPYMKDTTDFNIQIIQDTARAEEIREYFQLDKLYAPDSDTWTKALAIGKFIASNIPHDNQKVWPESVDAIGLWEYTKNVAPAFNCRLHSILAFELFLAAGLDARYITCMSEDLNDNDCHVVNEVWLPELGKWAMIDTDMRGHYVSDLNGIPLSLKEMRELYISGEKMMVHPAFKKGHTRKDWYYAYMAKNTYWFACWGELSYYQEDYKHEDVIRDHYVCLIPSGFKVNVADDGSFLTTDAESFWAPR